MFPELKQDDKSNCWRTKAKETLIQGMTLYGYCCGFFGRDSYGNKEILATYVDDDGDFVIRVSEGGHVNSTCFSDPKGILMLIESSNNACGRQC